MKRRDGFTLVELLVVIGIIGLLVSILLPSLSKARVQAQVVVCMSNLRQLGVAQQAFAIENQGRVPDKALAGVKSQFSWVGRAGTAPGYAAMTADIRPLNKYLAIAGPEARADIAFCPGDLASRNATGVSTFEYYGTSYAQNQATEATTDVNYLFTMLEQGNSKDIGIRLTRLRDTTRIVTMAEAGAYQEGWTFAQPSVVVQRWHSNTPKYNLLFADGHVGQHLVQRSDKGATTDWSFYWNK